MAVLKTIKQKSKEFIFEAYDNKKSENPAKVIFSRFPFADELYPIAKQQNVLESAIVKDFDNSIRARERLVEHIINIMVENITANRIDYNLFLKECVERFEDSIYDDKEIKTVTDFLTLPSEAIFTIAQELYLYAKTEDKFTITEKKILK